MLLAGACSKPNPAHEAARDSVVRDLDTSQASRMGFEARHLEARDNPIGDGVVVYATTTGRVESLPQKPVWIEWKGQVHAANGPAKTLTPNLPWGWPRPEAGDRKEWIGSGLVVHSTGVLVDELY